MPLALLVCTAAGSCKAVYHQIVNLCQNSAMNWSLPCTALLLQLYKSCTRSVHPALCTNKVVLKLLARSLLLRKWACNKLEFARKLENSLYFIEVLQDAMFILGNDLQRYGQATYNRCTMLLPDKKKPGKWLAKVLPSYSCTMLLTDKKKKLCL